MEDPFPVYNAEVDGDEVGKEFELLGWGKNGPIGGPYTDPNVIFFYGGKNVVDSIYYNMMVYTMSEGDEGLPLEAIAWSGDSGGPALIDVNGTRKIAGVNSNGSCCNYGDEDEFTRLGSDFAYKWIMENIADSSADMGVLIDDCSVWGGAVHLLVGQTAIALLASIALF